jgi:hypothetical protein
MIREQKNDTHPCWSARNAAVYGTDRSEDSNP